MKALRTFFVLFVVVAGFYVAWKVLPPYFSNYQFEDAIASEARMQAYSSKSEQDIRDLVLKRAADLDISLRPDQVVVSRTGDTLNISADYTVHIDLPLYPLDLKFQPSSKGRRM